MYLYVYVCVRVQTCAFRGDGVWEAQKRVSTPWKLEIWEVVN